MTGPSSAPRGEHTPRPGVTWQTELVSHGEQYAPECGASIRGTCLAEAQSETACDTEAGECVYATPMPRSNRAARRAARKKNR